MRPLDERVLVLNKSWRPVSVEPASESLVKMWCGKAVAIDGRDYSVHRFGSWVERGVDPGMPFVRTTSYDVQVPEAIVLTEYGEIPKMGRNFSKYSIFKRDKYTCQYCGSQPGREGVTIDHVTPKAQGGKTDWTNCVTSCSPCNADKADLTPDEAGMKLRRPPVKPDPMAMLQIKVKSRSVWRKYVG